VAFCYVARFCCFDCAVSCCADTAIEIVNNRARAKNDVSRMNMVCLVLLRKFSVDVIELQYGEQPRERSIKKKSESLMRNEPNCDFAPNKPDGYS